MLPGQTSVGMSAWRHRQAARNDAPRLKHGCKIVGNIAWQPGTGGGDKLKVSQGNASIGLAKHLEQFYG